MSKKNKNRTQQQQQQQQQQQHQHQHQQHQQHQQQKKEKHHPNTTNHKQNPNKSHKAKKGKSQIRKIIGYLLLQLLFLWTLGLAFLFLSLAPYQLPKTPSVVLETIASSALHHLFNLRASCEGVTSYRFLHILAAADDLETIEFLFSKGIYIDSINAIDSQGSTALHYAAAHGHLEVCNLLLKNGANLTIVNDKGTFAPQLLAKARKCPVRKATRILENAQAEAKLKIGSNSESLGKEMKLVPVKQVFFQNFTYRDFFINYELTRTPVLIKGAMPTMLKNPWTREYIGSKCPNATIELSKYHSMSNNWANLVEGEVVTLTEFLSFNASQTNGSFIFDWPLPINCPQVMDDFTMPKYFANDFLQIVEYEDLRDSWPSLFIAHKGTHSGLHIDAFGSHFWMLMLSGHKHWRFVDREEAPLLYPNYDSDNFFADIYKPNYEKFPLLRFATVYETILEAGDLLFVPAGTPHQVRNLDDNMAISGNYIDQSNVDLALRETYFDILDDGGHKDLHQQLKIVSQQVTLDFDQPDLPWLEFKKHGWDPSVYLQQAQEERLSEEEYVEEEEEEVMEEEILYEDEDGELVEEEVVEGEGEGEEETIVLE